MTLPPSKKPRISPTKARRLLWQRGILTWKLRPEQKLFKSEIEKSNKRLVVGNISRRWGKTFTLVLYAIEQALRRKQKIRYGAAFASDLEEFILPAFEHILDDCPESIKPKYMSSRQCWVFPNGSEIKLVGLDKKPNGLRGNAINIIILDEAGFISTLKYQYTSVIIPATMKQKNVKIIVISTPPESPEHYFTELITKAQTQPDGYYLCLTIDDISDLDPEERQRVLDEVGGEESTTARREFFCEIIVDASRAICPSFNKARGAVIKDIEPEHVAWRVFGDFGGVKDLSVYLKMGWDWTTQRVVIRDELWFPRLTPTTKIMDGIREKFGKLPLLTDAHGQTRSDLFAEGLMQAEVVPEKDSFNASLLLLDTTIYNQRVWIHPDCKLLIRTLEAGMLTRTRGDFERTDSLGHCDAAMAMVYGLRSVDRTTDLRPKPNPQDVLDVTDKRSALAKSFDLNPWSN